jgi:hypothetical protein
MRATALAVAVLLLVAACSKNVGGQSQPRSSTPSAPPHTSSAAPSTSQPPPQPGLPAPTAPISEVTAWIQAGEPADAAGFHSATRDGDVTQLQDGDVAFTSPSGKTRCMFVTGDLACLVKLVNPPPQPADVYGQWLPGWIEFDGTTLTVGSVHGDPGRFIYGDGAQLPYGEALKFGDYQCRSDQTGVFCVNYAHLSAVRISDTGVQQFGCLQPVPAPPDIGVKFSC